MSNHTEDEEFDAGALADMVADELKELAIGPDGSVRIQHVADDSTATLGVIDACGGQWRDSPVVEVADSGDGGMPGGDAVVADVEGMPGGDAVVAAPTSDRVRVLPAWDKGTVAATVAARASQVGFHVVRSPWYALRGLGACVRGVGRWVAGAQDAEVFSAAVKSADLAGRRVLRAARLRGQVLRFGLACVPVGVVWVWVEAGQWGLLPAVVAGGGYVAAAITGWRAGVSGKTPRELAITASAKGRKAPPLSRPFVSEALDIVGCGKSGDSSPVIIAASRVGGSELLVVELAPGVTVSELVKKHEKLASALGRPTECVVIEGQPEVSAGRFELFIADKTLAQRGAPKWAWRKGGKKSFFDGVPVGVDARGRDVVAPLFETHGMVTGATGMGKTYSARLLLLGAALDPRVTLMIHNLKGGADYQAFGPVAHTLRAGSSPEDIAALVADLEWIRSEIARRGKVLEGLGVSDIPEGKLTDAVASRDGFGPLVLLMDEAQRAYAIEKKNSDGVKVGDVIAALVEDIVRTGRAVGVHVEHVTQGSQEGAIPSQIVNQSGRRIGHGTTNSVDGNQALGSDAHSRGYRTTDITSPGVAYVGSAGGSMVKVAMAKVDLPEVAKIVTVARKMRESAGMLSGMAAGVVPADTHDGGTSAFLADVLAVWPVEEDGERWKNVRCRELAPALAEHDAGEYGGVEGPDVTRRMGDAGVHVGSQRTPVGEGKGVKLVDVERAAQEA